MTDPVAVTPSATDDVPRGDAAGLRRHFRADFTSGFFVFLIALPLCLGIAQASGFPPVAGVFTAVVGALITSLVSNSELTIKGPAAGLIVIVVGAMQSFGFTAGADAAADFRAYRLTLAVGVVAAVVQVAFGLLKAGALGEFFPTAVVHGMLAAIGVIICLKQLPVVFGQKAAGEPLEILAELPEKILHMNPRITVIGLVSLAILFGFPLVRDRLRPAWLRRLPAQLIVLAVAVPLAGWFNLADEHTYSFLGHEYRLNDSFLVSVPGNLAQAVTTPDFSVFTAPATRDGGRCRGASPPAPPAGSGGSARGGGRRRRGGTARARHRRSGSGRRCRCWPCCGRSPRSSAGRRCRRRRDSPGRPRGGRG